LALRRRISRNSARFPAGEIGGRLVEDQEFGAAPLGARGRDELLLADRQRGELRGGGQIEAEPVEQLLPLAHHRAIAGASRIDSSRRREKIGGDGQMRAEHDFLMDGVDAEPIASCGLASATGWPSQKISPLVRGWTPVSSLISVDLPAPFSPTIA
jgi:hypothetical protein